jgi:hypothetical protein
MQIEIPKEMLESIIGDYEYWSRQLVSVVSSNSDLKHYLDYKDIANHLKLELDPDYALTDDYIENKPFRRG